MPQVSIIIPTLNEADNLPILIPRIAAALANRSHEILILDDSSQDNTEEMCQQLTPPHNVQLITRKPENGISGAVLQALGEATGEYLVVMDTDLQHPPENIS